MKGILSICCLILVFGGCQKSDSLVSNYPEFFEIVVQNNYESQRMDAVVSLSVADLVEKQSDFNVYAFVVLEEGKEVPSQAVDANCDGKLEGILLVTDFPSKTPKTLTIRYAKTGEKSRTYRKRTQAELSHKFDGHFENRKYVGGDFRNVDFLRVPPEHTDHSFFIRYEGPGWESDKVGYRFYLDWRNAVDIFGKKTQDMVLQNAGLDGFDSYHEMADWGVDILKVGESLGIGSIGMYENNKVERVSKTDSVTCQVVANGAVYSQIRTIYSGWQVGAGKYDLVSDLSITAGSRLTKYEIQIAGSPPNICTGIVKHEKAKLVLQNDTEGDWAYLATYGQQTLFDDGLGMAILFRKSDLIKLTEDELSHVVVLKPNNGKVTYYFLAAWQQEPNGIQTEDEFSVYLDKVVGELNTPINIVL